MQRICTTCKGWIFRISGMGVHLQGPHSGGLRGSVCEQRRQLSSPRPHRQAVADRHSPCSRPVHLQSPLGINQKVAPTACPPKTPFPPPSPRRFMWRGALSRGTLPQLTKALAIFKHHSSGPQSDQTIWQSFKISSCNTMHRTGYLYQEPPSCFNLLLEAILNSGKQFDRC